ncbi:hypothetical protein [Haladaptatus cibarius]|uniref:hypothetical protein n=1 Tax=Haladaptatus cibarius TaxID=453847 RepID=UPI0006798D71|nr:hypothetical protein [Haladaptatus cibarius]
MILRSVADRPMDVVKAVVVATCWILTAAVIVTHLDGALYPSLTVGVGLVVAMLAGIVLFVPSLPTKLVLTLIVALSVFYRTYIVLFPASYLGMDPDKFAAAMVVLMKTGRVTTLDFNFYGEAPAFLVSGAMTGQVLGLPGLAILDVYAVAFGFFFPLVGYVLARSLATTRAGLYAALLGSVATASVMWSVMPIAQTLAVAFWLMLLFVLGQYLEGKQHRYVILTFVLAVSLLYTHKATTLLVFGTIVACAIAIFVNRDRWSFDAVRQATSVSTLFVLALLSAVFVFIQLAILTDYLPLVVGRLLVALGSGGGTTTPPPIDPTAAVPVAQDLASFVFRRSYGLLLVPLAGLGWFLLYRRSDSNYVSTVLAGSAVAVALMSVGVVSLSAVNPSRIYFFAELLFCVLVAATILNRHRPGQRRRLLVAVLLPLLLFSQLATPLVAPDHPQGERQYLTAQEVEAKQFSGHIPGRIATDMYYAREVVQLNDQEANDRTYVSVDGQLLNGTVTENGNTSYVAFREDARVYRLYGQLKGRWRLTYNPTPRYDRAYDRVYTNGGVSVYDR